MTYSTINESMKTNNPVTIISEKEFSYKGNDRVMMIVKKANGKKHYSVIKYENGTYSTPVTR